MEICGCPPQHDDKTGLTDSGVVDKVIAKAGP